MRVQLAGLAVVLVAVLATIAACGMRFDLRPPFHEPTAAASPR